MDIDLKKAKVVYKKTLDSAQFCAKRIADKLSCGYMAFGEEIKDASVLIVIGGDGTLLKCARQASEKDIPVFGFNLGRLGFLAQADLKEEDSILDKLRNGEFRIEERLMLKDLNGNIALNDFVVKNIECSKTSDIELKINGKQVCSYLADGLIISTPTGSTAYNLSAGGAVIAPEIECITIVPICAHTLSARPLVVSADDTLEIHIKSADEFQMISDGQPVKIKSATSIIKKHDKKAKLLLLNSKNKGFYDVLRTKLHWGVAAGDD